jgi:hypothetical protein
MPYIKQSQRKKFDHGLDELLPLNYPETAGELNYLITTITNHMLAVKGENYQLYNDIIGALECCKLEIYRRKIAAYEDEKIKENGDV